MINVSTFTKAKGSSSSTSSSGGGGTGYGNYVANISTLESKLQSLNDLINDWFSFDSANNAVRCNYDLYSNGSVSALGYGGGGQPAPPQRQYITDGLVFHLDGINKGSTADAWTDLIGGLVFLNNGAIEIPNGWMIYNSSSNNTLRNTDTISWSRTTSTIEVVYTTAATAAQVLFSPSTSGAITMGFRASSSGNQFAISNVSSSSNKVLNSPINIRGTHTVSLNINDGLIDINNSLTVSTANSYFGGGEYNDIGGRSTSSTYAYNGNIYSIRIYNRLLTESEMRYNQSIDNQRFNLNITEND